MSGEAKQFQAIASINEELVTKTHLVTRGPSY